MGDGTKNYGMDCMKFMQFCKLLYDSWMDPLIVDTSTNLSDDMTRIADYMLLAMNHSPNAMIGNGNDRDKFERFLNWLKSKDAFFYHAVYRAFEARKLTDADIDDKTRDVRRAYERWSHIMDVYRVEPTVELTGLTVDGDTAKYQKVQQPEMIVTKTNEPINDPAVKTVCVDKLSRQVPTDLDRFSYTAEAAKALATIEFVSLEDVADILKGMKDPSVLKDEKKSIEGIHQQPSSLLRNKLKDEKKSIEGIHQQP